MIRDSEFDDATIRQLLVSDAIERNETLMTFMSALNTVPGNAFLSIDADWGAGKTVFAKQLHYLSNVDEPPAHHSIDTAVVEEFQNKYLGFYYNAWEHDHHEDPLQSLLFSVLNTFYSKDSRLKNRAQTIVQNSFDSIIKEGVKTITAGLVNIEKINQADSMDKLVEEISTVNDRKKAVSDILNTILPKDKKLLFIVDELDRCNPKFAVNLMEVLKHYYTDDNIVFVTSTNNRQLVHTIKKYYGNDFDGYGYLDKLYDVTFELPKIDVDKYYKNHLKVPADSYFINITPKEISKFFDFSMRKINRYYSSLLLVRNVLDSRSSYNQSVEMSITNYFLIPLALALKIENINLYDKFLAGNASDMITAIVKKYDVFKNIAAHSKNDSSDPADFILEVYRKVVTDSETAYTREDYNIHEAGRQFRSVVPLMNIVSKIKAN